MERAELESEGLLDGVETAAERDARAELIERLLDDGVPLDEVRQAVRDDRLALLPVARVFSGDYRFTLRELAERTGLGEDFLARDWRALGLPVPEPDEPAFTEADADGLRGVKQLLDLGVSEEGVLELARVVGQGSARFAESALQIIGEHLLEPGATERDLGLRFAEVARALEPLSGAAFDNPLRLHFREIVRRQVVGRAERESGRLPGASDVAVCFADLVGFTRLGESMSAAELGILAERLEGLAIDVTRPPVRLVKTIGDAAMLVSPDASAGLAATLELVAAADAEAEFPRLRAGVAYGPALAHLGDWYGRPVNLASRITAVALPGSVLATSDARDAAGDGFRWSRAPSRRFKGIHGEVSLYRVRPLPGSQPGRPS
jgi:adenylate cyclase